MQLYVFCFLSILTFCFCAQLPPSFKKCSRNREDFQKCLVEAVEDAVHQLDHPFKEVGLQSIDPLEIPSLEISPGSGAANFHQRYNNVSFTGFSKIQVSKFDVDFDKKVIELQCNFPKVIMSFDYDFEGKILVLPFYGKGPGVITSDDMKFIFTFDLEEYEKKTDKFYKIVKSKLNLSPRLLHFKLDNLFGGDEQLGKNINDVFNDNWQVLLEDIRSSYEKALGQIFTAIFNRFLEKVSISELFPLS